MGLLLAAAVTATPAAASTETSCDAAAARAERDWNIPAGILSAVGTVESGRAGPWGTAPWPWTINAAGRGTHHETKGDAVATVLAIMIRGFPYIDVGCFQVDLAYHPGVFRSLDDAFDPDLNAQAAARILMTERSRSPDWDTAVARYHSATASRGNAYLDRVRSALPAAKRRASAVPAGPVVTDEQRPPDATKLPAVIYARPIPSRGPVPQLIRFEPIPAARAASARPQPQTVRP